MEIFGISTKKLISPNIRILVMPILSLLVLIVVFPFSFGIAYPEIKSQMDGVKSSESKFVMLEEKLSLLRQVKNRVLGDADVSLLALPEKNPVLWTISQLNLAAENNSVVLFGKKAVGEVADTTDLYMVKLTLSLAGEFDDVISFLREIESYAPLTNIEKVSLKGSKEEISGQVEMVVYRAELPTMLPAITAPIKNYTSDEQNLLDELAKLKTPEFTRLFPSQPGDREDPFN